MVEFSNAVGAVHRWTHSLELWLLLASAVLISIGATLEVSVWRKRARPAFPWLFTISLLCFLINAAIVFGHQRIEIPFVA